MPGFPIRTSSDQRFVGNSPRHNAASHVLHRLSMPRHPPYALVTKQKHTTKTTNKQPPHNMAIIYLSGKLTIKKFFHKNKDARVHYTVLTQHTPHTNHHHNNSDSQHMKSTRQHNCCLRHPTVHQHTTHLPFLITNPGHCATTTTHPTQQQRGILLAGVSPPGKQIIGSHTHGDSTNNKRPTTVGHKNINSLERR